MSMYSISAKSKLFHCRISQQGLPSYSICYVVSLQHSCTLVFSGLNTACPNNLCNKRFRCITYAITIQATTRGSCCMVMSRNMNLLARNFDHPPTTYSTFESLFVQVYSSSGERFHEQGLKEEGVICQHKMDH